MSPAITTLGPYTVIRELGRGSFAVVYLAKGPNNPHPVAVKLLQKSTKDQEVLARFDRESELGFRLQHPGIVPVLDQGLDPRGPYLVLEYQEGGSLADRLARGPLSSDSAAEVVVSVARAVHAAHEQDVIHRDLKPANILFDGLGNPRVTDLGLAHDAQALEAMTRTGDVLGTPFYMSPEQISGSGVLDRQTDVYSLGVILYECLTGRRPYATQRLDELVRMVIAGSPAPLGPGISPRVRGVCRKAMAADRSERYASAEALADALDLAILPPAPPPRYGLRAGALLALGGVLVAGAAFLPALLAGKPAEVSAEAPPDVEVSWERLERLVHSSHPLPVIEAELRTVIQASGESPFAERAQRLLALTLWQRGQLREAVRSAGEGTTLARYLEAQRLEAEGALKPAEQAYMTLALGESPIARLSAVACRRFSGRFDLAKQDAVWLEPGEDGAFRSEVAVARARVAIQAGELDMARSQLEASLELQPKDFMAWLVLGSCARVEGDRVATLGYLDKAIAVCEPAPPAFLLMERVNLCYELGDDSAADALLDRVSESFPDHWLGLFYRGRREALDQNRHQAEGLFRRAATNSPSPRLFVTHAFGLPEEVGEQALRSGGFGNYVPELWASASLGRRAKAIGGGAIQLALQAAHAGESVEQIARYFQIARNTATHQDALAYEEALFYAGRDLFVPAEKAIERARELGFDPDLLRLLEGHLAGRRSLQDDKIKALEEVASTGQGTARLIAFSEIMGYKDNHSAAARHAEQALEAAPDDPLAWTVYVQAVGALGETEKKRELERRLQKALPRFGNSWVEFLELDATLAFFSVVERGKPTRERYERAMRELQVRTDAVAQLGGGTRALLKGADLILTMGQTSAGRQIALGWLDEAERRILPHQRHEILLTRGFIELTRPKSEFNVARVLHYWREACKVEPKSKMPGNWYQLFERRVGNVDALAEFGEDFLPDPEDRKGPQ